MFFKVIRLITVLWFISLATPRSIAQHYPLGPKLKNYGIRANMINGYSFYSKGMLSNPTNSVIGNVGGLEVGLLRYSTGEYDWERNFGGPVTSISFQALAYTEPDIYGSSYALIPALETAVLKRGNNELRLKLGLGGVFITRQYDRLSNPTNLLVSTALNYVVEFEGGWHRRLDPQTWLGLDFGFLHFSNGSVRMPNNGFNLLYSRVSISQYFSEPHYVPLSAPLKKEKKHGSFESSFSMAYKELGVFNPYKFFVFFMSQQYMRPLNTLFDGGIRFDLIYDPTPALRRYFYSHLSDVKENEKFHAALGLAAELKIADLRVILNTLHYLYNLDILNRGQVYARFGLKYYLMPRLFISSTVRSTLSTSATISSEFMEWGLGYKVFYKKDGVR